MIVRIMSLLTFVGALVASNENRDTATVLEDKPAATTPEGQHVTETMIFENVTNEEVHIAAASTSNPDLTRDSDAPEHLTSTTPVQAALTKEYRTLESLLFQGNEETELIEKLMANYRGFGLTRPVKDIRQAMTVRFRMSIDQFSELDEHTGNARIVATVSAGWTDEFLKWNHTDEWKHIETLLLRGREIFKPVIIPIGSNGDRAPIFHSSGQPSNAGAISGDSSLIWTESSGLVHASATESFDTTCKMDVADFPFDQQVCEFYFKVLQFRNPRIMLLL